MSINKPDLNELILLFEPEQEALDSFFEKYKEEMNSRNLEKDLPLDAEFLLLLLRDWIFLKLLKY